MLEAHATFQFDLLADAKAVLHVQPKARRDAIKSAGGVDYAALLARERAARAKYRLKNPEAVRANRKKYKKPSLFKTQLCSNARKRARKRGFAATITPADIVWPTHCPVLGIELDYAHRAGERGQTRCQPNWPTLDRWDNAKGYVPGNVFVISFRANTLKSSSTYEEILRVAKYLSRRPT